MAIKLESLELEVTASAQQAVSGLDALSAALSRVRLASEGGAGLRAVASQTAKLSSALSSMPTNGANQLRELRVALESLSEGTYGNTALNSAARQLRNVSEAVNSISIDPGKLGQLNDLKQSLAQLSSVEAAKGLNSTINALMKLPDLAGQLEKVDMDRFAGQLRRAADALAPLASEMEKVSRGFAAFPVRIQKIIASNEGLSASNRKTAQSYSTLRKASSVLNLAGLAAGLRLTSRLMGAWVEQSNAYVENLNLFNVAMGKSAKAAYDYAQTVRSAVGIDPSDWMRNQGVFMQIASGFGVAEEKAVLMSKNLTQLGYDISSFFNIRVEEAMQKVQSGISGELEPLRRLGYALDQATLKEVARANGITKSMNAMTQAEKSQLRYIAMLQQSKNVMGDMARTVVTPANAMRILQQQIQQLTRALGDLLIPMLMELVPVVQAAVEVITELINRLAALAGFSLPTIDYSGLDAAAGAAGGVEEGLEDAAKAAKKLSATLGIDELNIIKPPDEQQLGTQGGGQFGDLKLPEYDFLKDVTKRTDELKKLLKQLLNEYILPIGAALAAWKLAGFLTQLRSAVEGVGLLKKALAGAIVGYIEFKLVKASFDEFLSQGGGIKDFIKAALLTALGSLALYAMFGPAGLVVGIGVGMVAAVTSLTAALAAGLDKDSWKVKLMGLFLAASGAGIGFVLGGPAGAAVGAVVGLALTMNVVNIGAQISGQAGGLRETMLNALLAGIAGAGVGFFLGGPGGAAVGFVIGATVSFVVQKVSIETGKFLKKLSPILKGVEVLDDTLSDATSQAVGSFLDSMKELSVTLGTIQLGGNIISDRDLLDVAQRTSQIVATITGALDSQKNQQLAALDPLRSALGEEKYAQMVQSVSAHYESLSASVSAGEAEIAQIMAQAQANNTTVSAEGWERIWAIQSQWQSAGVQGLSQTQVEYETIMRNLSANTQHMSLEQASAIIKNAMNTRDSVVQAAEEQYTRQLLEAQKLVETGAINQEQYDAMIAAAKLARDETVAQAQAQYQNIFNAAQNKLGELGRYIDETNGGIKSMWSVFWEDANKGWDEFWGGIYDTVALWWGNIVDFFTQALPTWWEENIAPWFTKEKWIELGTQAWNGLIEGLTAGLNQIKEWGEELIDNVKDALGIHSPSTEFEEVGEYALAGLANGFDRMGEITQQFKSELDNMRAASEDWAALQNELVQKSLNDFLSALDRAKTENARTTNTMAAQYRSMASQSNAAIGSIIDKLNSIPREIITIHRIITVSSGGGSSGGGSSRSSSSAKGYAAGGFPRLGELFYARENGPELVGSVGGKTAVANNDQIVAAVSQGVAQAVEAVLRDQGGGAQNVNVYLDGRQIRTAVERSDREAGAGIMKGGSYYP